MLNCLHDLQILSECALTKLVILATVGMSCYCLGVAHELAPQSKEKVQKIWEIARSKTRIACILDINTEHYNIIKNSIDRQN